MKVLGLVLFLLVAACAKHEQYKGWKSFFLKPTTPEQLKAIKPIADAFNLDILSHPILRREGVVLVKPEYLDGFLKSLEEHDLKYWIHSNDVKAALDLDDMHIKARKNEIKARNVKPLPYDNYQELDVIYEYIDDIAARYPETVTLIEPANSFEGRTLKYLKISTTNFEDDSKPVIVIDGGIHANEWISPPSVTWAIKKLVEDVTEPDLLERFDWVVMPVVNPDGYVYSHTDDRLWRKTRSTDQHPLSGECPGVDANRNFDFKFGTVGTSLVDPCLRNFGGSHAFSEVEARVVRDIMHEHLHRMALYLTIHSYGSMILYPWGHDGSLSNNSRALHAVGIAMAEAIDPHQASHFPAYVVGNSLDVVGYGTSGDAEDYAHSLGVPIAYTVELPGLGSGSDGFLLPPEYIERVSHETWQGIVVGAREAGDLFSSSSSFTAHGTPLLGVGLPLLTYYILRLS